MASPAMQRAIRSNGAVLGDEPVHACTVTTPQRTPSDILRQTL